MKDMFRMITSNKGRYIILIILVLIVIAIYVVSSMHRVRTNNIIIFTFYENVRNIFNGYSNVSIFILRSDCLNYYYKANTVVILTHTANLQNKTLLIALVDRPDVFTIYGINISGQIYKAIPISDLASKISADKVVIIGCNIRKDLIYDVFKDKTKEVYYYKCPADPEQALDDLRKIVAGKIPEDKCLEHIIYESSR